MLIIRWGGVDHDAFDLGGVDAEGSGAERSMVLREGSMLPNVACMITGFGEEEMQRLWGDV